MLFAYEAPQLAVDSVDQTVGEAMLDVLTSNTVLLDALSFRAPDVTSSSAGKDTSTPGYYVGVAPEVIWRGSFQKQAGMTTLTIEGWAQKGASESFQLFLNGVGMLTQAVPNGAAFTLTCSLAALANDAIGEVIIQITGSGYGGSGVATKYVVYDAYVSPISVGAVWSGVPTFAGTYSAALLNQMANAQAYLAARLNAIPYQPYLAAYYTHGSSVQSDVYPLWWGAVERANGANILNIRILPMIMANLAEYFRVTVNGTIVHTSPTLAAGTSNDYALALDLSAFAASARLETKIETVITTGAALGPSGDRNSRYHLWDVRMSNAAPAVAAAPYDFTADESLSSTSLDTKLNALAATLAAAYARIVANPRIFSRVPLMRRMYGRDAGQYAIFGPANTLTQRFTRKGSRLIIRGKGVKVGWGAITTKAEKTLTTAYSVDFAHTLNLTDGDAYQTKTIYLDSLEGLRRGQAYSVIAPGGGDLVSAAEYGI